MNQEQLLSLIDKLDQSSLAFLNYETDDVKLVLSKEMPKEAPVYYGQQEDQFKIEFHVDQQVCFDLSGKLKRRN